jgi:hypothetical protein
MKSVVSKRSNWTSLLLLKELFNGAFELLFLPKAFLYGPDLPGSVYEVDPILPSCCIRPLTSFTQ